MESKLDKTHLAIGFPPNFPDDAEGASAYNVNGFVEVEWRGHAEVSTGPRGAEVCRGRRGRAEVVVVGREEVVSIWTEPDSNSNRCGKHLITWSRNASVIGDGRLRSLPCTLGRNHSESSSPSREHRDDSEPISP